MKENSKHLDDKLKAKLHASFAEVDNKRRAKKLAKVKGTVRQLYQTGQYDEGDKLLHNTLTVLGQPSNEFIPDDSDSTGSAAS